jgi:chromosomal replication initiation ATPase DnaA
MSLACYDTPSHLTRRHPPHRRAAAARPKTSTLGALLAQTVGGVFEIDGELLHLPTRGPAHVARARQVAMYLAHVGCELSLTEAGELFGRDRTTAKHACCVVEERREEPHFDRALDLLERVVRVLSWPRQLACLAGS